MRTTPVGKIFEIGRDTEKNIWTVRTRDFKIMATPMICNLHPKYMIKNQDEDTDILIL
jgi:hypothetical protein